MPSRVEPTTRLLLDMLDRAGVRATFFVVGWVAERHPRLVEAVRSAGHEIGSHGYGHQRAYDLGPDAFRDDLRRSLRALSAIGVAKCARSGRPSGRSTIGRSGRSTTLVQEGFTIDASMAPVRMVGAPSYPRHPHVRQTVAGPIVEVPPLVADRFGQVMPLGWGWGLRMSSPRRVLRAIEALNREGMPAVITVHPWELDPDPPRVRLPLGLRFAHYFRLGGFARAFDRAPRRRDVRSHRPDATVSTAFVTSRGDLRARRLRVPVAAVQGRARRPPSAAGPAVRLAIEDEPAGSALRAIDEAGTLPIPVAVRVESATAAVDAALDARIAELERRRNSDLARAAGARRARTISPAGASRFARSSTSTRAALTILEVTIDRQPVRVATFAVQTAATEVRSSRDPSGSLSVGSAMADRREARDDLLARSLAVRRSAGRAGRRPGRSGCVAAASRSAGRAGADAGGESPWRARIPCATVVDGLLERSRHRRHDARVAGWQRPRIDAAGAGAAVDAPGARDLDARPRGRPADAHDGVGDVTASLRHRLLFDAARSRPISCTGATGRRIRSVCR